MRVSVAKRGADGQGNCEFRDVVVLSADCDLQEPLQAMCRRCSGRALKESDSELMLGGSRSTGIVPHEMFRSWRCFFFVRADHGQYSRSVTYAKFRVMASWYSKSAEKWCDSASLPIRLHRTTCTLVCVSRPESRVHQSVIMSTMLATDSLFG